MFKKLSVLALGLALCAPAFSYVVVEQPVVMKTMVVRERPVVVKRVVLRERPVVVRRVVVRESPVVVRRVVFVRPTSTFFYPVSNGWWY
jgi:hypothetical protein